MDQEGAVGSRDLKKDRSHAQELATRTQTAPTQTQSVPHANGPLPNGVNGVLANGVTDPMEHSPTVNGEVSTTAATTSGPDNPPPLDQSWRDMSSNISLGKLIVRTAGQCYYDLDETLRAMAEVPVEPQQQQLNGIVPHTGQDTSEGSLTKKRKLMEFANGQRDRFIKALVLSDWCRNAEEKGRLIDVKVWQDKQNFAHRDCTSAVANTKNNMIPAKMPNPNIEGAMEVLATGKGLSFPDMGYIPPKRLTARQLLKTLRNMNVILATRLNLHEELPTHFRDFSIADGRATFTVQDEFEVDLSVAEEDPATPFYFIDIRLLYHPTSDSLDDRLRAYMEQKVNHELATKGLKGCYDFLHSFALTHKINVLRSQAAELIRGKWFDCIRIESMRRSLVVQYWAGMPGPKSWIEIGISSGKQKDGHSRQPPTPKMAVRWFRRGVEMKDELLDFDWRDLDLERCLSIVIAKHSAQIMDHLRQRIQSLTPPRSPLVTSLPSSESATDGSILSLRLPSSRQDLRVHNEPVTGQFSLSPPSLPSRNTEGRLNSDPAADSASLLANLVCVMVRERTRKDAELLGWNLVTSLTRQDNLQRLFGEPIRQLSIFRPTRAWGESWALAATCSLGGEKWWATSLEDKRNEQSHVVGKVISRARCVSQHDDPGNRATTGYATLTRVKEAAEAEVAFSTNSQQLRELQIPHEVQKLTTGDRADGTLAPSLSTSSALFIRFSSLLKDPQNKARKPWAGEMVRLTHHGIQDVEGMSGRVRHDLRLSLEPGRLKELQKHVSHSKDRHLVISSTSGLALRFLTSFGQPVVKQMQQRLQSVDRLDRYLTILKDRNYLCTHVSSSRLEFTYSSAPGLGAEIIFSSDDGLLARLKLFPPDSNPHLRIRVMLEQGLNQTGDAGFEALTYILGCTLPVMRTFEQLETKDPAKQVISVHPRSSTWFSVKYRDPLPSCVFQLRAKTKYEGKTKSVRWLISNLSSEPRGDDLSEELDKAAKALWQENGEHWNGIGNGIVADAQGIATALEKLDEVIRRCEGSTEMPQGGASGVVNDMIALEPPTAVTSAEAQAQAPKTPQKPANPQTVVPVKSEVIELD